MASYSRPPIQAHFLEKGIHQISEVGELSKDLSSIFLSLEKFQKEVQDCKDQDEVLCLLQQYLYGLNFFHETAFYWVKEDKGFEIHLSTDVGMNSDLESVLMREIRAGRFAWALQQNRSVLVESSEALPGKQVLLHSMSTRMTTLGMLVGLMKDSRHDVTSSMMSLISIMVAGAVYVLENQILQTQLLEHNKMLEGKVAERTRELSNANETLLLSNSELKRLNEKKSEFMGIAAHDLKNPLTAIFGCSSLVLHSLEEKNEASEDKVHTDELAMLKRVDESAQHMLKVIDDLLDSEALESGDVKLKPKQLDLGGLAKKVVIINELQAKEKSIELNFETEEDMLVKADALRMHEAVDNFVSNAVKYSKPGSRVWVSVGNWKDDYGQNWVKLMVKDEGPGLTEKDKEAVFGRFKKLSARPTGGESSTGLGLSIVKRLVELHYGHIWVESEHGKGSEFCFRLPRLAS